MTQCTCGMVLPGDLIPSSHFEKDTDGTSQHDDYMLYALAMAVDVGRYYD